MPEHRGAGLKKHFRFAVVLALLAIAWIYIKDWYSFREPGTYLIFAGCLFLAGFLSLSRPQLILDRKNYLRKILILFFCILLFPYGEWFRINFPDSREVWSRQILIQVGFLGLIFGVLSQMPIVVERIHKRVISGLDALARSGKKLLYLPLAFTLFTIWIAFHIFRATPLVQDTAAHLFQARIFASGKVAAAAPPIPEFFDTTGDMLVIRNGHWASMYQFGFPLLISFAMLFHAEYALLPVLGGASIALWIFFVSKWYGDRVGLIFGFFAVLSPFLFLMFSTPMIHGLELFLCSSILIACRSLWEKNATYKEVILAALLFVAVLVRGFSILVFIFPALFYTMWLQLRIRKFTLLVYCFLALVIGGSIVSVYQGFVYGDPFTPGYTYEYAGIKYGFGENYLGQIHTPLRALEQISNNLLGLNAWLGGWYSGSLFFLIVFFLRSSRVEVFDRVLLLCCLALISFYFFFVGQDLVIGPRYVFVLAPVGLLFISRLFAAEFDQSQSVLRLACLICFVSFLPLRLPQYLNLYEPSETPQVKLNEDLSKIGKNKVLVFIESVDDHTFVNQNDPFFRSNAVLCRDLSDRNHKAAAAFPAFQPVYFRRNSGDNSLFDSNGGPGVYTEPRMGDRPSFSFVALTVCIQNARERFDFYDTCYRHTMNRSATNQNFTFLQEQLHRHRDQDKTYQQHFRLGMIHTGLFLILPQVSYQEYKESWSKHLDPDQMNLHWHEAVKALTKAGEPGREALNGLKKVQRRIDQDRDGLFSARELQSFLHEKIQILALQ
jgi:hypothetical protein